MKASPQILERRRAAVRALLVAEAAPGIGRFSIPVIAELLQINPATARSDASQASRFIPSRTHGLDRNHRLYPLGVRWHANHNHTEQT